MESSPKERSRTVLSIWPQYRLVTTRYSVPFSGASPVWVRDAPVTLLKNIRWVLKE